MVKLVIFDLDGTAIPNKSDGMPSERLIKVVKKLQSTMKVCAATGRPHFNSKPIIQKLGLRDPCIISGGTQIIDPLTQEILWEKTMSASQVKLVSTIAMAYSYKIFFSGESKSVSVKDKTKFVPETILCISSVTAKDTQEILQKCSKVDGVIAHQVMSWVKNCFDIHITHKDATKKHALQILLKMLNITPSEVVAAGDSNNDLPLFESAGYKIAMANGSDDLKKKADLIAGHVDEDGLAIALEKKLLSSPK